MDTFADGKNHKLTGLALLAEVANRLSPSSGVAGRSGPSLGVASPPPRGVLCITKIGSTGGLVCGLSSGIRTVWPAGAASTFSETDSAGHEVAAITAYHGRTIIAGLSNGTLICQPGDAKSRRLVTLENPDGNGVTAVAVMPGMPGMPVMPGMPGTREGFATCSGGLCTVWGGDLTRVATFEVAPAAKATCVVALSDCLAVGDTKGHLTIWSGARKVGTFRVGDTVTCMAVSPDNAGLVFGSSDGALRVWDASRKAVTQTMQGAGSVTCVACAPAAPGGPLLVSGSSDGTLHAWNPATGALLKVLRGHGASVTCVAALADGCFASGSLDGTVRFWDLTTRRSHSLNVGKR